eukprot:Skav236839  [mRNA]  locus=scaffold1027:134406:135471:- [translate_table: standard]
MKIIRTTSAVPKNSNSSSAFSRGHVWQTSLPPSDHAEKRSHFWQVPSWKCECGSQNLHVWKMLSIGTIC